MPLGMTEGGGSLASASSTSQQMQPIGGAQAFAGIPAPTQSGMVFLTAGEVLAPPAYLLSIEARGLTFIGPDNVRYRSNATSTTAGTTLVASGGLSSPSELQSVLASANPAEKASMLSTLGAAGVPGAPLTLTASTALAFASVGHNRTCISSGAGPFAHTISAGWPADADIVIIPLNEVSRTFSLAAGVGVTLVTPTGASASSSTAELGIVTARAIGIDTWMITSAAQVSSGGSTPAPTSHTLFTGTTVPAAGIPQAVATSAPKTLEFKVLATGSGSIVAQYGVFASFDGGTAYNKVDTMFVTGADQAGASRSLVLAAQMTHLRVDLEALTTTGVTSVSTSVIGLW